MGAGRGGGGPGRGGTGCAEFVALSSNHTASFGINYESQSCCYTSIHQATCSHYQPLSRERNDYWKPSGASPGCSHKPSLCHLLPLCLCMCVWVCGTSAILLSTKLDYF